MLRMSVCFNLLYVLLQDDYGLINNGPPPIPPPPAIDVTAPPRPPLPHEVGVGAPPRPPHPDTDDEEGLFTMEPGIQCIS